MIKLKGALVIPVIASLNGTSLSGWIEYGKRLQQAGADALELNSYHLAVNANESSDAVESRYLDILQELKGHVIDLETLEVLPKLELSSPSEALLRIRWSALLYGRTKLSLAVAGGFHQTPDVLKALLAGADVVHLCSVLLKQGVGRLTEILTELEQWLVAHEYESISQLKGSVSQQHAIHPSAYERANYVQVLDNYFCPAGVLR